MSWLLKKMNFPITKCHVGQEHVPLNHDSQVYRVVVSIIMYFHINIFINTVVIVTSPEISLCLTEKG